MSFGKKGKGSSAAAAVDAGNTAATNEIRRQFNITQEQLKPFIEAGERQLPILEDRSTVGGLDAILGEIFGSENFQNLRDERTRAVEGQLAAGGLTRSGTALEEAAAVPTDLGFIIEQMLTGRSSAIAGQGQGSAVQLGNFGAQSSGNIANLLSQTGNARSSGILADQQSRASGIQNTLNTAATVASIFFSDPSLKENVEEIGELHGLKLYQWDWIEATKDTMIEKCSTIGFMADEVKSKFPQYVHDFAGFMMIDYPELITELEAA